MKTLLFLSCGLVLAGCASSLSPEDLAQKKADAVFEGDPRRGDEVKKICFASQIDGFSSATKHAVVLSEGRKNFLVTTSHRCSDLDHALSLSVKSTTACLSRGDKLLGRDTLFGGHQSGPAPLPCYIDRIYEWDPKAEPISETDMSDLTEAS